MTPMVPDDLITGGLAIVNDTNVLVVVFAFAIVAIGAAILRALRRVAR